MHVQVTVWCRSDEDDFLLLASDGLWDVMTNQVTVNFVSRQPPLAGCQCLSCARAVPYLHLS